jgi:hypothetical protein
VIRMRGIRSRFLTAELRPLACDDSKLKCEKNKNEKRPDKEKHP